jgi:DNA-binding SARP family transcriptional activator
MTASQRAAGRTTVAETPSRPTPELRLLNAFDLTLDGESIPLPLPAQRVIAFLALSDRPVQRSALAGRLWSDGTEPHALGSLRSALWRVRRRDLAIVETSNGCLELLPHVAVDVQALLAWSRRQLEGDATDPVDDVKHLRSPGELLPDWYDDWVILERERLREVRVRALEALCNRLTVAAAYARASEAARAAIRDDPLRESAHRCLVRVHLSEGNSAEAIRAYRLFRKLLLDRIGLEPSDQMKVLVAGVMRQ